MSDIKHVWFDLEGTLTIHTQEFLKAHNESKYRTYAEVVKKPVSEELKQEYEMLYKRYSSNSAVFRSLGLPSDYWQQHFYIPDELKFFKPDSRVFETLRQLKEMVSVSLFTNAKLERIYRILTTINVDPKWFTFILTGDDIKERKPALDGFYAIIEKSQLSPEEILYIGDRVDVDIKPAKIVGMKTCLVWSKSEEADFSFENFEDTLTIFQATAT